MDSVWTELNVRLRCCPQSPLKIIAYRWYIDGWRLAKIRYQGSRKETHWLRSYVISCLFLSADTTTRTYGTQVQHYWLRPNDNSDRTAKKKNSNKWWFEIIRLFRFELRPHWHVSSVCALPVWPVRSIDWKLKDEETLKTSQNTIIIIIIDKRATQPCVKSGSGRERDERNER